MKSPSRENQADIIEAFNSTSGYLDDLLSIDNIYFDQMVDSMSLRKHAYSNILKISPPKTKSFQMKILIFFQVSAQNIDCGTRLNRLAEAVLTSTYNICFEQKQER